MDEEDKVINLYNLDYILDAPWYTKPRGPKLKYLQLPATRPTPTQLWAFHTVCEFVGT